MNNILILIDTNYYMDCSLEKLKQINSYKNPK